MIKHLTPRSKKEIRINKFKDFFILKEFFYVSMAWHKNSFLLLNKKWWNTYDIFEFGRLLIEDKIWKKMYLYTYITREKEIQKTIATILICKRTWKRYWKNIHIFNTTEKFIEIKFDPPIGETRLWPSSKLYSGRCVICDYKMHRGETPFDALKRMEKERKFN